MSTSVAPTISCRSGVGRRPREGRLLLAHDRLRAGALAQQLLEPVEQVIALAPSRCRAASPPCRRGSTAGAPSGGARPRSRSGRGSRSSSDPPHHEIRALGERPAGHDGREAAGAAAGHDDLDVLRRAELRDQRRTRARDRRTCAARARAALRRRRARARARAPASAAARRGSAARRPCSSPRRRGSSRARARARAACRPSGSSCGGRARPCSRRSSAEDPRRAAALVVDGQRRVGGEQRHRARRSARSRARPRATPTGSPPRARRCSTCSGRDGRAWTC